MNELSTSTNEDLEDFPFPLSDYINLIYADLTPDTKLDSNKNGSTTIRQTYSNKSNDR